MGTTTAGVRIIPKDCWLVHMSACRETMAASLEVSLSHVPDRIFVCVLDEMPIRFSYDTNKEG